MTREEAVDVTNIYSVIGLLPALRHSSMSDRFSPSTTRFPMEVAVLLTVLSFQISHFPIPRNFLRTYNPSPAISTSIHTLLIIRNMPTVRNFLRVFDRHYCFLDMREPSDCNSWHAKARFTCRRPLLGKLP